VYPLGDAIPFLEYAGDEHEVAAVAKHSDLTGGSSIFLGFGFEGISGINNSTTRAEFMSRMLDWFGAQAVDDPAPTPVAANIWLAPNYPNPFNPSTTISFYAPPNVNRVTLGIFNLLGQRVAELFHGTGSGQVVTVHWNSADVASGSYIVKLIAGDQAVARTIQLVR
jgi:hypothetical protein